jgi:hypothetical protein
MRASFTPALLLTLSWGALAFGSVYPWAYWPLVAALSLLGLWGLFEPTDFGRRANGILAIAIALLAAAVVLQLVPLSSQWLSTVSPAAPGILRKLDIAYAAPRADGQVGSHPLTIEPEQTRLGLLLLLSLGTFFLGLTRTLDGIKLRALLPWLTALGVVLAMAGIVQKPLFTGKIYGFWTPSAGPLLTTPGGGPFGPFVNRNHFAGWMLMALPLTIGYFSAMVERDIVAMKVGWRDRLLWFASREANQALLVGFAILLMGLSLVMTLSRSGITCFMISLAIAGFAAVRRQQGRSTRAFLVGYFVFVAVLTVAWAGVDVVALRFQGEGTLSDRGLAWQDALHIIRAFPWTGTGLNTYGTAMLFYQTYKVGTVHFAEAHNDYLQLLAEGGVLLVVPTLIVIGCFAREVRRRFREGRDDRTGYWLRLGAVTGLVAVALQEIVEFSLQMPGNAALFVLLCGIAVRRASGRRRPAASARLSAVDFRPAIQPQ